MAATTNTISMNRELEVRHEVDVLVAGGGPSGVAAALTAARQGLSVRIIDGHTCLGGMGTAGMVPAFMQFTDGINFMAGGIGKEILGELQSRGGTMPPDGYGIRVEVLKRVYDDLVTNAGIGLTFHTQLVDVVGDEGSVREVICAGKSGLFAIRAKVFIDGTGDGDLAAYAGAPYEKGDENGAMMPGTLCSIWASVDWDAVKAGGLGTGNTMMEKAFENGVFTLEDRHLPGVWRVGENVGGGNVGHTFNVDGTDEESLTTAYLWGRKSLPEYERYYKEYMKGFEAAELVATGSLLGIRETRRITGDYMLGVDDFSATSQFDDEIGRYSYPVDIHVARPDRESYDAFKKEIATMRLGAGENYGIPYRILTPQGLSNVLVAGRCVSTDRSMQASIRVMPGCYITGQAAGMAASLMVRDNTDSRSIDITELQSKLVEMGGYLPNAGS
jgi:hypothetical protein